MGKGKGGGFLCQNCRRKSRAGQPQTRELQGAAGRQTDRQADCLYVRRGSPEKSMCLSVHQMHLPSNGSSSASRAEESTDGLRPAADLMPQSQEGSDGECKPPDAATQETVAVAVAMKVWPRQWTGSGSLFSRLGGHGWMSFGAVHLAGGCGIS
jgi:hypothetical protein